MIEFKETDKLTEAVNNHIGLVKSIASKYVGRGLHFNDLVQHGWLGFMKAYNNYDENKGAKLSSYAYKWIEYEIINALNHNKSIHIPIYRQREYRVIKQHMKGTEIDYEALEKKGFSKEYVNEVINDPRIHIALDREVGEETSLLYYMEGDTQTPEEVTSEKMKERALLEIIRPILTDKQYEVILYSFGFKTGYEMSNREVGEILGMSAESVRKVKLRALKRLQTDEVKEEVRKI